MSKYCPQCSETAPGYATLCRHCFYDFKKDETPKKFPLAISIGLLLLGLMAYFMTNHLTSSQNRPYYHLHSETQSLLIAQVNRQGTTVDRLPFSDIKHLEHIIGGSDSKFAIDAVLKNGESINLKRSDRGLEQDIKVMSSNSDLEYETVNHTRMGAK
jgi:hypothetical protein